ncbi:hypothetical protein NEISICOT_00138 [Neisseria sicca ATCC 29256]|uniref:Uncharacterized protein n=1 Tax=Neisseria sicca ATCC 29256 TaxID=547045 RepID=C6M0W2_NEISI|nr:hypothetical protein NEISICOT_00138 [Neisseria sicca ATCC 29256]
MVAILFILCFPKIKSHPSIPSNTLLKPYSVLTWQGSAVKIQKELYPLDMLFQTDLNVITHYPSYEVV